MKSFASFFFYQAALKLGPEYSRFVIKNDGSEIEDDEVFIELIKDASSHLELVALRPDEEYGEPENI